MDYRGESVICQHSPKTVQNLLMPLWMSLQLLVGTVEFRPILFQLYSDALWVNHSKRARAYSVYLPHSFSYFTHLHGNVVFHQTFHIYTSHTITWIHNGQMPRNINLSMQAFFRQRFFGEIDVCFCEDVFVQLKLVTSEVPETSTREKAAERGGGIRGGQSG